MCDEVTHPLAPLKFGNEWVMLSQFFLGMWLLIHPGIRLIYVNKTDPWLQQNSKVSNNIKLVKQSALVDILPPKFQFLLSWCRNRTWSSLARSVLHGDRALEYNHISKNIRLCKGDSQTPLKKGGRVTTILNLEPKGDTSHRKATPHQAGTV